MKFSATKENLLALLAPAQTILEKRSVDPRYACVLLDATTKGLSLYASNGEISVKRFCDAETKEPGKAMVPGSSVYSLIREFPDGKITIETKDNNWIQLSFGKSKFNLAGVDSSGVQDLSKASCVLSWVPSKTLSSMIDKTIEFTSTDETRYHLQGVLFETDGNILRAVATDGHRLSKVERSLDSILFKEPIIIPRRGLIEIKRFCDANDEVGIGFENNQMVITDDLNYLSVRLIESKFPNYQSLIKEFKKTVSLDRNKITSSLKRISNVMNRKSRTLVMSFDHGSIELSGNDQEVGEGRELIESDYDGVKFKIGLNGEYLAKYLGMCDGDIDAHITTGNGPVMFKDQKDKDHLCLIMPVKI